MSEFFVCFVGDLVGHILDRALGFANRLLNTSAWAVGEEPLPPKKWSGRGRPAKRTRRDAGHQPTSVKHLALNLPSSARRKITWREGAAASLSSRFARVRVRVAHGDYTLTESRSEEWLLIVWPKGEAEPTKYWLSTLPEDISFHRLVDYAKLRWRIEGDYLELKQEVGLGDFEGADGVGSITTRRCPSRYMDS